MKIRKVIQTYILIVITRFGNLCTLFTIYNILKKCRVYTTTRSPLLRRVSSRNLGNKMAASTYNIIWLIVIVSIGVGSVGVGFIGVESIGVGSIGVRSGGASDVSSTISVTTIVSVTVDAVEEAAGLEKN